MSGKFLSNIIQRQIEDTLGEQSTQLRRLADRVQMGSLNVGQAIKQLYEHESLSTDAHGIKQLILDVVDENILENSIFQLNEHDEDRPDFFDFIHTWNTIDAGFDETRSKYGDKSFKIWGTNDDSVVREGYLQQQVNGPFVGGGYYTVGFYTMDNGSENFDFFAEVLCYDESFTLIELVELETPPKLADLDEDALLYSPNTFRRYSDFFQMPEGTYLAIVRFGVRINPSTTEPVEVWFDYVTLNPGVTSLRPSSLVDGILKTRHVSTEGLDAKVITTGVIEISERLTLATISGDVKLFHDAAVGGNALAFYSDSKELMRIGKYGIPSGDYGMLVRDPLGNPSVEINSIGELRIKGKGFIGDTIELDGPNSLIKIRDSNNVIQVELGIKEEDGKFSGLRAGGNTMGADGIRILQGSIELGKDLNDNPRFSVDNTGFLTASAGKIANFIIEDNRLRTDTDTLELNAIAGSITTSNHPDYATILQPGGIFGKVPLAQVTEFDPEQGGPEYRIEVTKVSSGSNVYEEGVDYTYNAITGEIIKHRNSLMPSQVQVAYNIIDGRGKSDEEAPDITQHLENLTFTPTVRASALVTDDSLLDASFVKNLYVGAANIGFAEITTAHISELHGSKIVAESIEGDRIAANSIEGDRIKANTITVDHLNFTPVGSDNIIATINASEEGLRIASELIRIDTNTLIVDGSIHAKALEAGTITGDLLTASEAVITTSAQIANAIIKDAHIDELSAGKITSGLLDAEKVTIRARQDGQSNKPYVDITNLGIFARNAQGQAQAGFDVAGYFIAGGGRLRGDAQGFFGYDATGTIKRAGFDTEGRWIAGSGAIEADEDGLKLSLIDGHKINITSSGIEMTPQGFSQPGMTLTGYSQIFRDPDGFLIAATGDVRDVAAEVGAIGMEGGLLVALGEIRASQSVLEASLTDGGVTRDKIAPGAIIGDAIGESAIVERQISPHGIGISRLGEQIQVPLLNPGNLNLLREEATNVVGRQSWAGYEAWYNIQTHTINKKDAGAGLIAEAIKAVINIRTASSNNMRRLGVRLRLNGDVVYEVLGNGELDSAFQPDGNYVLRVDFDARTLPEEITLQWQWCLGLNINSGAVRAESDYRRVYQNDQLPLRWGTPRYSLSGDVLDGCFTGCEVACEVGCETTCQGSCESSCQDSCQSSCQTGCQQSCQSTCETTSQGGGGCIREGTPITIWDEDEQAYREVPVETLVPGMILPGYNPETDTLEHGELIELQDALFSNRFLRIHTDNGPSVDVTYTQPFDVLADLGEGMRWYRFVAKFLQPGMKLVRPFDEPENRLSTILDVERVREQKVHFWLPKTSHGYVTVNGYGDAWIEK